MENPRTEWRFVARKIIDKWIMFHCYVRLPEGSSLIQEYIGFMDMDVYGRYTMVYPTRQLGDHQPTNTWGENHLVRTSCFIPIEKGARLQPLPDCFFEGVSLHHSTPLELSI